VSVGEYGVAMTEQSPEQPVEAPDTATADEAAHDFDPEVDAEPRPDGPSLDPDGQVRTGNVTVDAVLASLEGLVDRPVSEHVEVFEHAHEQLRGALDGDPAGPPVDR
jgi:hypothetical protein